MLMTALTVAFRRAAPVRSPERMQRLDDPRGPRPAAPPMREGGYSASPSGIAQRQQTQHEGHERQAGGRVRGLTSPRGLGGRHR